jgi:hypothetical protein
MTDHLMTFSTNTIEIPPMSLVIDMTALDEISEWAHSFKEIVLMVDGEDHHYKTEDVLEILKQIEL